MLNRLDLFAKQTETSHLPFVLGHRFHMLQQKKTFRKKWTFALVTHNHKTEINAIELKYFP